MKRKWRQFLAAVLACALLFSMTVPAYAQEAFAGPEPAAPDLKILGNDAMGYVIAPGDWKAEFYEDSMLCTDPAENRMVCVGVEEDESLKDMTKDDIGMLAGLIPEFFQSDYTEFSQIREVNYQGHDAIAYTTLWRDGEETARIGLILYLTESGCAMVGAGGVSEEDFAQAMEVMKTYRPGGSEGTQKAGE